MTVLHGVPCTRATAASWLSSEGSKDVSTRPRRIKAPPSAAGRAAYCGRLFAPPPLKGTMPEGPQNTSNENSARKAVLAPVLSKVQLASSAQTGSNNWLPGCWRRPATNVLSDWPQGCNVHHCREHTSASVMQAGACRSMHCGLLSFTAIKEAPLTLERVSRIEAPAT